MKWLGSLITGLLLAALTAVALAFLQPVVRSISPERTMRATIEASKWLERPTKEEVQKAVIKNDPETERLAHAVWMYPEQEKFLAITFSNEGSETAKNIRVRFEDEDERPTALIVTNDGLTRQVVIGKSSITIPDMTPGEKSRLYLWAKTAFPRVLLPDNLKIYSSAGPFEITYSEPTKTRYFEHQGPFFRFLDKWLVTIFGALVLALVILLFVAMFIQQKYFRKMLHDPVFYGSEKARYDVDPNKFVPTM